MTSTLKTMAVTAMLTSALTVLPVQAAGQQAEPLYARLGGYDRIAAMVDDFLARFDADPLLAPFLGGINDAGGKRIRQHFVDFICAQAGGPCYYNGRDMKAAHEGLRITRQQFDAVMTHLGAAIDAVGIAAPAKRELLTKLSAMASDVIGSPGSGR